MCEPMPCTIRTLSTRRSAVADSFTDTLLEYPQYTRPRSFAGLEVPEVLLSGDHEAVRRWRRGQALLKTRRLRPDLFARLALTGEEQELLQAAERVEEGGPGGGGDREA